MVTPFVHTYELAPVPFNDVVKPIHITELVVVEPTVGNGLTVMVLCAVFTQPLASVPVTVYVTVLVGEKAAALVTPFVQTYELAPVPLNDVVKPIHITELVVVEPTVGNGLTVMVLCAVFTQPLASVPVTVYVTVLVGEKADPFVTPFVHTYELAPVPLNEVVKPMHITELVVVDPTVGNGLTNTVAVIGVETHPSELEPIIV